MEDIYAILGERYQSGEHDVAARHDEHQPQIDAPLKTKRDQKWIDEALASGPATPLAKKEMETIRDRLLRGKRKRRQTDFLCGNS